MRALVVCMLVAGCGSAGNRGAPADLAASIVADMRGAADLTSAPAVDGGNGDGGSGCEVFGAPGQCMTTSGCAALGDHSSYAGHCPGPADIQCCIVTPNVANNPPTPAGYKPMMQSEVTPAMTNWAVVILDDPTTYPMFSTTMMTFGPTMVLARVEWHPPDFQNGVVHRGVTLYEPQ
jgi:hypothetical protein